MYVRGKGIIMPKCFDNLFGWKMDVEYVLILAINKIIYYSQKRRTNYWGEDREMRRNNGDKAERR